MTSAKHKMTVTENILRKFPVPTVSTQRINQNKRINNTSNNTSLPKTKVFDFVAPKTEVY